MSKELDYNNLSDEDKTWLRARGWGHRIPGEVQTSKDTGVVIDANASAEEQLANLPNTGTATFNPADEFPSAEQYTEEDYLSWKVEDLKAEIEDRNKDRDEADHMAVSGKKAELVQRLVEDDEAQASPSDDESEDNGE